jgi:hypothetical protein
VTTLAEQSKDGYAARLRMQARIIAEERWKRTEVQLRGIALVRNSIGAYSVWVDVVGELCFCAWRSTDLPLNFEDYDVWRSAKRRTSVPIERKSS